MATAVQAGHVTVPYIADRMEEIIGMVEIAFATARMEPKITDRAALAAANSQPLDLSNMLENKPDVKGLQIEELIHFADSDDKDKKLIGKKAAGASDVMRKHMTKCFDEFLHKNHDTVYIGEDVEHGGYVCSMYHIFCGFYFMIISFCFAFALISYYLVTDGLAKKYPGRVIDFPPDETSLVGAAIGFSQAGLATILEIPYAKYLDCACDMFTEAVISNWLTNGRQPNGMVVRLQGFDKGIFGGNFHTHNMLNIPPGLDVVCFSNGRDYVRGMRSVFTPISVIFCPYIFNCI